MEFNNSGQIRLTSPDGAEVMVDLSKVPMNDLQKSAFSQLQVSGFDKITQDQKDLLKDLKSVVSTGDVSAAFVCTFDLRWVKIN